MRRIGKERRLDGHVLFTTVCSLPGLMMLQLKRQRRRLLAALLRVECASASEVIAGVSPSDARLQVMYLLTLIPPINCVKLHYPSLF